MAALLVLRPDASVPIAIFLVQFLTLDCLLSLSFLRWTLLGPNYFAAVHRGVYRWNWSPPAKSLNTAGVVVLILVAPAAVWPAVFAALVAGVKVASLVTVARLFAEADRPTGPVVPVGQAG
jgi:CDP-diacylglycerol--glycerol-3-phosphate 3-phosphatidyltransferase